MRRSRKIDEFEVLGVADKLPYEMSRPEPVGQDELTDDELMERAVTLLRFHTAKPATRKSREPLSPHDPVKGRRAVDALIEAALATVDARGRLQRIV